MVKLNRSAPLLEDINIQYGSIPFNGSFMQENIYRRKGSPEVDAAWEAMGVNCKSMNFVLGETTLIIPKTDQYEYRSSEPRRRDFEMITSNSIPNMAVGILPTSRVCITFTAW
jgi:hypothetical protein